MPSLVDPAIKMFASAKPQVFLQHSTAAQNGHTVSSAVQLSDSAPVMAVPDSSSSKQAATGLGSSQQAAVNADAGALQLSKDVHVSLGCSIILQCGLQRFTGLFSRRPQTAEMQDGYWHKAAASAQKATLSSSANDVCAKAPPVVLDTISKRAAACA